MAKSYHNRYNQRCDRGRGEEGGISSDAKYFLLSSPRHSDRGLIKLLLYTIFKSKIKKNTRLLLIELLAVTCVPCIFTHPICSPNTNLNWKCLWHSTGVIVSGVYRLSGGPNE